MLRTKYSTSEMCLTSGTCRRRRNARETFSSSVAAFWGVSSPVLSHTKAVMSHRYLPCSLVPRYPHPFSNYSKTGNKLEVQLSGERVDTSMGKFGRLLSYLLLYLYVNYFIKFIGGELGRMKTN